MAWYHPTTVLDKIFEGSLIVKGVSAALEFLGGLALFFVNPTHLHDYLVFTTQRELIEDPHDKIAELLLAVTQHFSTSSKTFLIVFLWLHASIKLIAVIGILTNQLWAYPFSLISLGLLMLYQVYDIALHHSVGMVLLTIFDVFILWLIWREYTKKRQQTAQMV